MYALHFTDTWAGRVFTQAATPLGLAIPIYSNTAAAGGMPILNPSGSGVNVELIQIDLNWVSGTATIGPIGLMAGFCTGVGTGTGCSVFSATTAQNGNTGIIGGSKVLSSNTGTVTVTAGTLTPPVNGIVGAGWVRGIASLNLEASSGTPQPASTNTFSFGGTIMIPPGVIVYLAGLQATTALFATTIVWKEIPITGR